MPMTTASDMFDVQVLIDAIRGRFYGKNAFVGSVLVASGAVMVAGSMPKGGQSAVNKTIDVPYFGTIGEFENNPDGSSVTPTKLAQTSEQGTIARSSLAVETSGWAQGVGSTDPALGDPYDEGADQAQAAATREMDRIIVTEAATTPLVHDVYSASNPVYLDHNVVADATTLWGDENEDAVAMVTHSQGKADLVKLTDNAGRPLLLDSQRENGTSLKRFAGVPLLQSDRVPVTGSTMGSVTSTGTSPPTVTLAVSDVTKMGPWKLKIDVVAGGASDGTATFRFSVNNGLTWSATLTVPNGGGAIVLNDTAVDSLIGRNGKTGVTATFANGTYNANNEYTATANLKVTSLIAQPGALAFWFNQARLGTKEDTDILADADIMALHLYYVAKLYRRRRMGLRPGVIAIQHNVRNYIG